MASTDLRDILDVKVNDAPRPAKKQKLAARKPEHMPRELYDLLGERAPPIAIKSQTYRTRPRFSQKARPWFVDEAAKKIRLTLRRELSAFTNSARNDGLTLKHWRKKSTILRSSAPATPTELKQEQEIDASGTSAQSDYLFAKFNVKINGPVYSKDEYEKHLQDHEWTKDETDYLIHLAVEYDLRWIVIADRYDYQSTALPAGDLAGNGQIQVAHATPRSMEDLKARYYKVAGLMMEVRQPKSSMTESEYAIYEKLMGFDPKQETIRKRLAEALLSRTADEIKEEELLLGELKRIVTNEERFLAERNELYSKLEYPPSLFSTADRESSQGLTMLLQKMLLVDKSKKPRRPVAGMGDGTSSPAQATSGHGGANAASREHRASMAGSSALKKGGSSGIQQRHLTPREEARFGVSRHERLTGGVTFRSGRIDKLTLAKSAAQAQKVQAALVQLQIPIKAVMPTAQVCALYEKLVHAVHGLLDVRKLSEKVDNELRVLRAQREMREKKERGEEIDTPAAEDKMDLDDDRDDDRRDDEKGDEKDDKERDSHDEDDEDDQESRGDAFEADADEDDEEAAATENLDHLEGARADESDEDDGQDVQDEPEDEDEDEHGGKEAELEGEEEEAEDEGEVRFASDGESRASMAQSLAPSTRSLKSSRQKRAASVMSGMSDKSSKKQRK